MTIADATMESETSLEVFRLPVLDPGAWRYRGITVRLLFHGHDGLRHSIGFDLLRVIGLTHRHLAVDAVAILLHDVSEFMRQQLAPGESPRVVFVLPEKDIRAGGEGARAQRAVEGVGMGIRMNAHSSKIGAESGFHLLAHTVVEPLPATTGLVDRPLDRRIKAASRLTVRRSVQYLTDKSVAILALQTKHRAVHQRLPAPCRYVQIGAARRLMRGVIRSICHLIHRVVFGYRSGNYGRLGSRLLQDESRRYAMFPVSIRHDDSFRREPPRRTPRLAEHLLECFTAAPVP
jgi:hypothetical protein